MDIKAILAKVGQVAVAVVLAIAVLGVLGGVTTPSAAAPVAPSDTIGRAPKTTNPHNKRIKPYKYEKQVRYTSESTQMPSTAPCSVLSANPSQWPTGVSSCYGPPAAKPKQAPAKKKPAAKPAPKTVHKPAATPRTTSRGDTTRGRGGSQRPYPASCG